MSTSLSIESQVNGTPVKATVDVRVTLAEFLRDELGLTGTKVSCELQVCGACTVLVDGLPVSACSFLAVDSDGREVMTIEGLSSDGDLHPIQRAFVEHFALQCGYCTPGFIMMVKALLDEVPAPTDGQIAEYLDGNICRCTGYAPIRAAVKSAAMEMSGEVS